MFPELLQIGPLTLHTYGLMVALGILAGVGLAEYLNRRQGGQPGQIIDMGLIVVLAGLVGARLMFIFINWGYYSDNPLEAVMIWKGGLVFYGGLLGGIVGLTVYIRLAGMPLLKTLDIAAPAMALGHSLGRLGCFSAGCCYGKETDLPWAVIFTDPRSLATNILGKPVHPTQLYSFAFLALLALFLVWTVGRKKFDGQVAALYVILYSVFRFVVEFYRGDPRGGMEIMDVALSTSQVVSLVLLPIALVSYLLFSRSGK
jgi:phosphatidylglycerol:prolipoprotein diacylglycerol transferase